MRGLDKNIFIVVPCYNEESRLGSVLKGFLDSPYRFVFVNDGSRDDTLAVLRNSVKPPNYVISLDKNAGKAEAVRRGIEFIKTLDEFSQAEWVGYWDADMAAPIGEIPRFIDFAELAGGADAVYGSRVMRLGSVIKRSPFRHALGRVFCTLISLMFGLESYDTQCGAKLFKKGALGAAFDAPFTSRWIFDVEIILRLRSFKQIECPLGRWEDVKGSKVAPLKIFLRVAEDIRKIYKKYGN